MSWGRDSLIEFQRDLVVVPRLCELCLSHDAVAWWYGWWPDSYLCRLCLDQREWELENSPPAWLAPRSTPTAVGLELAPLTARQDLPATSPGVISVSSLP